MDLRRLSVDFFDRDCVEVAKELLGRFLVRLVTGSSGDDVKRAVVRIVETEAYVGYEDKASHSYKGRRTARNAAMFMEPGTAYVYNIYGMYQCLNISTRAEGSAVLLRAAEPVQGIDLLQAFRAKSSKSARTTEFKPYQLCNGPSKLCQALDIRKENFDQVNLCRSDQLFFATIGSEPLEYPMPSDIVETQRIGIAYAEEWSEKPLRFYIRDSPFVSMYRKKKTVMLQ